MNPTSMLLSFLTLLLASSVFTVDAVENGTQPYSLSVGTNCTGYSSTTNRSWIQVINNSAAEFLSVHFTKFNLPPNDYLIIKATDPHSNETIHTYYTRDIPNTHDFFSTAIIAKSITIQLVTTGDSIGTNVFQCPGFEIDMYRFMADSGVRGQEDVCGADNSVEAACAQSSVTPFKRADAVVRLLIHKETASYFCTGWLVGCEGHMITNNHCISTQAHASNTEFEFRAQAGACPDSSVPQCNAPLACKGTVRARSSQLIYTSTDLDYTLVKLDINFSNDYGYLQLREAGAAVGDSIYLIGHPAGWGKRIVLKDDTGMGKVISTTQGGCLDNQVAYYLDTLGGSSGSPVLSAIDNSVVALHHCGGCPNTAVNSNKLVADMRARNILPNCAVYSPPTASPTTLPAAPRTAPPTAPPTAPSTAPPTSAPTTTAPPPKPRRSTRVDGTIVTTAMAVTIDYIDFVLTEASTVEVDLLSMEATTTDLTTTSFVDVNGDCNAGYIDSSIVLFKVNPDGSVTESTVVATNDDAPAGYGKEDGSISSADSYLTQFLSPGRYRVAVGVSSMTTAHAVAESMPLATTPRVCDTKLSNYGSYRLTLWTTSAVTVTGPNTYIGSQCTGENTVRPYSKCSYHQEAPLTKSVALDGTIVRTGGSVSVDYLPFTMPSFGRITIDLTSFESVDGFTYTDVNGFCTSSYIDAVAYLFRQPTSGTTLVASDIINAADDDDSFVWRPQRMGVSFRDPFLSLALPIGKYMLVVGRYPMTLQAAIDKINTASPGLLTPESCGDIATQGNYRVTIASARDLSASAAGTFVGVKCQGNKGKQLCAGQ